jgi:hypothetical protein
MPSSLSRRTFLRAAGAGAAAAALSSPLSRALAQVPTTNPDEELLSYNEVFKDPPMLGRMHGAKYVKRFTQPRPDSHPVGDNLQPLQVVPILRSVRSVPYDSVAFSPIWFETDQGYVHSAYVVPCHEFFNEPEAEVPTNGFWAQMTTPYALQHSGPSVDSPHYDFFYYRAYWQQVYKVTDMAVDDKGRAWYRVADDPDIEPKRVAWIMARALRRLTDADFAPISPDVTDKSIKIQLDKQLLSCYEGSSLVFQTMIASGTTITGDDGVLHDFSTAYGDYHVERKRPARRMKGGSEADGTNYDVNAVPWITYFVGTGAAIHGAYWHNRYGVPKSHGCINVVPDAAQWVYRWTVPTATATDDYRWTQKFETATPITIS